MSDDRSSSPGPSKSVASKTTKRKYNQIYLKQWKASFPNWLKASKRGNNFAFCSACNVDLSITSGKIDLERHEKTQKHQKRASAILHQPKLNFAADETISYKKRVKEAEIRMAAFIAEHNMPIRTAEHLPKLMMAMFPGKYPDKYFYKELKT